MSAKFLKECRGELGRAEIAREWREAVAPFFEGMAELRAALRARHGEGAVLVAGVRYERGGGIWGYIPPVHERAVLRRLRKDAARPCFCYFRGLRGTRNGVSRLELCGGELVLAGGENVEIPEKLGNWDFFGV